MYPESRHARASRGTCRSPALPNHSRCCFPTRLHPRQGERQPAHQTYRRRADLRFAASTSNPASSIETIVYDCHSGTWQNTSLHLPPTYEDSHEDHQDNEAEPNEAQ
jgi:hypothetical protein